MNLTQKIAELLRRRKFDNRIFWNERYIKDPIRGSGPGSRGENLTLKRNVIEAVLTQNRIFSVLDIGCGDIAVLGSLALPSYTGVDISDVIVRQNKLHRPDWTFLCEDLTGEFQPPSADLVLCLDVLIHQKSKDAYFAILKKSLNASMKLTLVSGYSKPDPGWNVFYHEPLTESIKRLCPKGRVEYLGTYRDTDLIKVQV